MTYAEHSGHKHYVTAISGKKVEFLAGPFDTHAQALAQEEPCREIIRTKYALNMDATFAEIGTTRIHGGTHVGKLNRWLKLS